MRRVIILRGLPGAGKSTWIRNNAAAAVICSADHLFEQDGEYRFDPKLLRQAHGNCLKKFIAAVRHGEPLIVVDNTNIWVRALAPYAAIAEAYGYDLEIRTLKVSVETSCSRNIHGCPRASIERMAQEWEDVPFPWAQYVVNPEDSYLE